MSFSVAEFLWKSLGDYRGASCQVRGALFSRQKSPQKQFSSQKNDLLASLMEESAFLSLSLLFKKHWSLCQCTSLPPNSKLVIFPWQDEGAHRHPYLPDRCHVKASVCIYCCYLAHLWEFPRSCLVLKFMEPELLFALWLFTFLQNDINCDN